MKAVLISIQPYWVFLIIAKAMGWNIDQEKTVEVRKSRPKAESWNKVAKIYCSKDKKSFAKIPKEYQPFMKQLLGKVIGEFVCDSIIQIGYNKNGYGLDDFVINGVIAKSCAPEKELYHYLQGKKPYLWHISNLIIYDKPKELSNFTHACPDNVKACKMCRYTIDGMKCKPITRPPQSWCYVEEVG